MLSHEKCFSLSGYVDNLEPLDPNREQYVGLDLDRLDFHDFGNHAFMMTLQTIWHLKKRTVKNFFCLGNTGEACQICFV